MTLNELKSDTHFLAGTDSQSYEDSDLERNINLWYRKAVSWIWDATGTWEYDDSNKNTLPVATTDLGDGVKNYTMPADAQKIIKVEVKNNNGDWDALDPIDKSEIDTPSEFFEDKGMPKYYDLLANVLVLYPTPASSDVTISGGLKLHVSREVDDLTASDDEPGFEKPFHRILSIGAAKDWADAYGDEQKEVDLRRRLTGDSQSQGLKQELEEYYGNRNRNRRVEMKVRPPKSR
jgi:hypothetical protein